MLRVDGYLIDVEVSGDHRFEGDVTSYPVEEGAEILDHVSLKPIEISIQGIVSDTPFGATATERDGVDLPSRDAYEFLRTLRLSKTPVVLETSLDTFDDMVLASLSVPTSAQNGKALVFTGRFIHVEFVSNERSTIRVSVPRSRKEEEKKDKPSPEPPYVYDEYDAFPVENKIDPDHHEATHHTRTLEMNPRTKESMKIIRDNTPKTNLMRTNPDDFLKTIQSPQDVN